MGNFQCGGIWFSDSFWNIQCASCNLVWTLKTNKTGFHKTMFDSSQLFCTDPPLNMGVQTPAMREVPQQLNFEPPKLSNSTTTNPFGSISSAFQITERYMGFQQQFGNSPLASAKDQQFGNSPLAISQFPSFDSDVLSCQSSGKNFSLTDSAEQAAGSNLDLRDSLQSLVKSHLYSSSNKSNVPRNNTCRSNRFPHDQNMFLGVDSASFVRRQFSLSSYANQGLKVIFCVPF